MVPSGKIRRVVTWGCKGVHGIDREGGLLKKSNIRTVSIAIMGFLIIFYKDEQRQKLEYLH